MTAAKVSRGAPRSASPTWESASSSLRVVTPLCLHRSRPGEGVAATQDKRVCHRQWVWCVTHTHILAALRDRLGDSLPHPPEAAEVRQLAPVAERCSPALSFGLGPGSEYRRQPVTYRAGCGPHPAWSLGGVCAKSIQGAARLSAGVPGCSHGAWWHAGVYSLHSAPLFFWLPPNSVRPCGWGATVPMTAPNPHVQQLGHTASLCLSLTWRTPRPLACWTFSLLFPLLFLAQLGLLTISKGSNAW